MKRKILHLITGLEIGGAEMMLLKTLPKMQGDFENRVCCIIGKGLVGKELEKNGIPVFYLGLNKFNLPLAILRFRKIIKEYNPDLLVNYLIHADLFGRIFGKLFGIKKIISNQRGFFEKWKFLRFFDWLTKSLVNKYVVQTEFAKKELVRILRISNNQIEIIPNAIEIDKFNLDLDMENKKVSLGILLDNLNITCVSTLKDGKGFEYFFESFEKIFKIDQKVNLLIVGDGNRKNKYLEQIKNYQSKNNIFFLGRRNDVTEILKISDIFVLATFSEGMSNAILEAMASKLPIITTDIPVNKELIENNVSGILVPVADSESIFKAMVDLIDDPEKRKMLGENAYQKMINNFEINIVIEKIKSLYNNVLKNEA